MKFKTAILSFFAVCSACAVCSADVILLEENFDGLPDQSARDIADFGANVPIGYTTVGPDNAGAGVWTRNGLRGFGATPDASFTSASGTVAQLRTHSGGGFGLVSVPLGTGKPPTGTAFKPISTGALNVGDTIRLTFDLFVQAVTTSTNLNFFWNTNSASGTQNTTWTEYKNASVGDVLNVQFDLLITAGLTDISTIGPQIQFYKNVGETPPSTDVGQLDNFKLEVVTAGSTAATPEPSSVAVLMLASGLFGVRRLRKRRKAQAETSSEA